MSRDVAPRLGTVDDIPSVASLFRKVPAENLRYLPVLHTPDEDFRYFRQYLNAGNRLWIVGDDMRPSGFCATTPGWIEHLYIDPVWQRHGLGTAFVATAKQENTALRLWAFQRNRAAIQFYSSQGFVLVEQTDGSGNEEGEPDALFAWQSCR